MFYWHQNWATTKLLILHLFQTYLFFKLIFYAKFLVEPLFEQKFITDCISTKVKINSFMRINIQIITFFSKTAQIFKLYQNFLLFSGAPSSEFFKVYKFFENSKLFFGLIIKILQKVYWLLLFRNFPEKFSKAK